MRSRNERLNDRSFLAIELPAFVTLVILENLGEKNKIVNVGNGLYPSLMWDYLLMEAFHVFASWLIPLSSIQGPRRANASECADSENKLYVHP